MRRWGDDTKFSLTDQGIRHLRSKAFVDELERSAPTTLRVMRALAELTGVDVTPMPDPNRAIRRRMIREAGAMARRMRGIERAEAAAPVQGEFQ